jgi:hypothetical protein
MFVIVAVLAWSLFIGLRAQKLGAGEQVLLLAGIVAAVTVQYFVFGPS